MHGRLTQTITGLTGLIATVVLGIGGGSFGTAAAGAAAPASTYQAAATFTGPITTGSVIEPISANPLQLAANGYVQQEFFAAGKATAFTAKSEPSNGRWSIVPGTTATYRTRILVRRPMNPAHFNGNVVVEWMNVSAGESAPDWDYLNPELMRAGFAYVAVSVQHLGVNGGAPILGTPAAVPTPPRAAAWSGPNRLAMQPSINLAISMPWTLRPDWSGPAQPQERRPRHPPSQARLGVG